jgi:EAL domain-containing protein (putative c-di-GMP-specific phosphodiesterase class I)
MGSSEIVRPSALRAVSARRVVEALAEPELIEPAFQPIMSLTTGAVVGYEAFSRFLTQPVRSPARWFAAATQAGKGARLQALAIQRILAVVGRTGVPGQAFLSVNISPRYLAHPAIAAALASIDPDSLVIEITEDEEVDDYARLRAAIVPYLRQGIRFAVDDAGAGFASMRHITELGPAFVKLDASLVRGLRSRQTLQAFLRAIHSFTSEIGATLIAEGVEGVRDLAGLTQTGLPLLAQGFAIAKPGPAWPAMSATAGRTWLTASRTRPPVDVAPVAPTSALRRHRPGARLRPAPVT